MEKFRQQLLSERDDHLRQSEELRAEAEALAAEREQGDTQFDEESGEGDTISVERERSLQLSAQALGLVSAIDQALERIKDGTYGYCMQCQAKIPVARLEAIPFAELCITCKSRGERRW